MQIPLQITFRETEDPTGAISAKIRERVEKLDKLYNNLIGCQVVVEAPHHTHHRGNLYKVRINLSVPGHKLVVTSDSKHDHSHEDVYVAVRDSFNSITRQLEELSRTQHGDIKMHHIPYSQGTISVLFPEHDSGRIVTADGQDIYFHRNCLNNSDFDNLAVGMTVEFQEEMGDDGLQATYVKIIS